MSDQLRITCPHCQASIKAPPLAPGSICGCPKCGKGFPLPGGSPASAASPAKASAVAATQPAHKQAPAPPQPEELPPPPPKPVEVPVVCRLCGTRMYATQAQIGKTVRCPDCHSETEVKPPKVLPPAPRKKTLDEMEEFQLSEPGERPAYRPMVEAKGEYAELQLLDTKAPPRKMDAPAAIAMPVVAPGLGDDPLVEANIPAPATAVVLPHPHSAVAHIEDDLDDQEVFLSAPVERTELPTQVQVPNLPPPKREERKEQSWNDAEWGFVANPREKDAWKKSPFYLGILGVFSDPQTLFRFAAYSVGLTVVLSLLGNVIILGGSGDERQIAAIFCLLVFAVCSTFWLLCFSPCLLAIATDTGNGEDRVQSWPDWSITEWLLEALYIPVAGIIAALPGIVLASMFLAVGHGAQWLAPFPPIVSLLGIFPIIFSSMLVEGSLLAPISTTVLKSIRSHGDGWIVIYVLSLVFFAFLSLGVGFVQIGIHMEGGAGMVIMSALAAVLFVALMILYFRLLGRLMWYTSVKKAGEE